MSTKRQTNEKKKKSNGYDKILTPMCQEGGKKKKAYMITLIQKINLSQQHKPATKQANDIPGHTNSYTVCVTRRQWIHSTPHKWNFSQKTVPTSHTVLYKTDVKIRDVPVDRTKNTSLESTTWKKRLKDLGVFSLEKIRWREQNSLHTPEVTRGNVLNSSTLWNQLK